MALGIDKDHTKYSWTCISIEKIKVYRFLPHANVAYKITHFKHMDFNQVHSKFNIDLTFSFANYGLYYV